PSSWRPSPSAWHGGNGVGTRMNERSQAILFCAIVIAAIAGLYGATQLMEPASVRSGVVRFVHLRIDGPGWTIRYTSMATINNTAFSILVEAGQKLDFAVAYVPYDLPRGMIVAVTGTLVMRRYANIETVFVATLLAGSLLGRWWTVLVPLSALVVQQTLAWSVFGGYALSTMTGVTFFVVSGYLFVALVGRRIRPRILFRVKSVALLTTISVPLTVGYDLWTAFGEWYFLTRPF